MKLRRPAWTKMGILVLFLGIAVACSSQFTAKSVGTPSLVSVDSTGVTLEGVDAGDIKSVEIQDTSYVFTIEKSGSSVRLVPSQNISLILGQAYQLIVSTANAQTAFTIQTEFPAGAIMAFNTATCPTGWSTFNLGRGRVLVGAGSGNNDADGTALTARALGDLGGREFTTGIPATTLQGDLDSPAPTGNLAAPVDAAQSSVSTYLASAANTTIGGAKADSNMMPYAVMLYCQKN